MAVSGTFGVLIIDKMPFCVTLEPPDKLNKVNKSNIPTGQYYCVKRHSEKYGETFEVIGVPERDSIIIHPGNVPNDTGGCIILAEHFGKIGEDRAVLNSGKTYKKFMQEIKDDYFHLTIKENY